MTLLVLRFDEIRTRACCTPWSQLSPRPFFTTIGQELVEIEQIVTRGYKGYTIISVLSFFSHLRKKGEGSYYARVQYPKMVQYHIWYQPIFLRSFSGFLIPGSNFQFWLSYSHFLIIANFPNFMVFSRLRPFMGRLIWFFLFYRCKECHGTIPRLCDWFRL